MANCIINPATGRAVKADGRTGKKIVKSRMGGLASKMMSANRAEVRSLYAGARGIATAPPPAKKKRGRPKGSKNKPK